MSQVDAVMAIAYRDLLKFLRDRTRIVASLIFPVIFIAALGGSLQGAFGGRADFNLLMFTFTGVFAQVLFQSSAFGLISILEDRESDFTQEIFVSPISRYSIVVGKIIGETLVAVPQAVIVLVLAVVLGIHLTPQQVLAMVPTGLVACLLGGSFGLLVLANLSSQRGANQVFPFLILPQYFLAGVFNPIGALPPYLDVLSHVSPLRYAVDLVRGAFYVGTSDYARVVLEPPLLNLAVTVVLFIVFLTTGTYLFVRRERSR